MEITNLGHCCLLLEIEGVQILTDPGYFSLEAQENLTELAAVLITHEHQDHLHVESLKKVLEHNPEARVITNSSVGVLLKEAGIGFEVVEDGGEVEVGGVIVSGHGTSHAVIYQGIPSVMNTGYMIGSRLYYPGDALHDPGVEVEILALPIVAPWLKLSEAIDYAKKVQPKVCFPVHDGFLNSESGKVFHTLPERILAGEGIAFRSLWNGESLDL